MRPSPEQKLKVLLLEDSPGDAQLVVTALKEASASFPGATDLLPVDYLEKGLRLLHEKPVDLILLDLSLPDASHLDGLSTLQEQFPKIPVVVLTGLNDESTALQALQRGAQDYLHKDELNGNLLTRSIRYAMERKKIEEDREHLIVQLREALANIKKLSGLLPICASCKQIRDDQGAWKELEVYISEHSEAQFTHGVCPHCADKFFSGLKLD